MNEHIKSGRTKRIFVGVFFAALALAVFANLFLTLLMFGENRGAMFVHRAVAACARTEPLDQDCRLQTIDLGLTNEAYILKGAELYIFCAPFYSTKAELCQGTGPGKASSS